MSCVAAPPAGLAAAVKKLYIDDLYTD
jgi:hypothetical protein